MHFFDFFPKSATGTYNAVYNYPRALYTNLTPTFKYFVATVTIERGETNETISIKLINVVSRRIIRNKKTVNTSKCGFRGRIPTTQLDLRE